MTFEAHKISYLTVVDALAGRSAWSTDRTFRSWKSYKALRRRGSWALVP